MCLIDAKIGLENNNNNKKASKQTIWWKYTKNKTKQKIMMIWCFYWWAFSLAHCFTLYSDLWCQVDSQSRRIEKQTHAEKSIRKLCWSFFFAPKQLYILTVLYYYILRKTIRQRNKTHQEVIWRKKSQHPQISANITEKVETLLHAHVHMIAHTHTHPALFSHAHTHTSKNIIYTVRQIWSSVSVSSKNN